MKTQRILSCAVCFFVAFEFQSASAAENNLHVSGGIAMPGVSTSALTNPAGLVAAPTAGVLQAGAPEFWNSGTYRAGAQTGASFFGLAGGFEYRDQPVDDATAIYYGAAVGIPAFSFGIGGKTGVSNANGTSLNAGLMFSAGSIATVGVTARGISDGINEWGAGVGFEVTSGASIVFDAAADDDFDNLEVKPGLKVGNEKMALTMSYGTGARLQFADGFTAGGSFQFSSNNTLEIQYNAG